MRFAPPVVVAVGILVSIGIGLAELPAAAATVAGASTATTDLWTPIGPPGGETTSLAFDPGVANQVWATMATGLFRSADGGVSWFPAEAPLLIDSHLVRALVAGGDVYAGGSVGIARSTDHGQTFHYLPDAPTFVQQLTAGTGPHPALYAAGTTGGMERSTDGGDTWSKINDGLDPQDPSFNVQALLVDPRRPQRLWAATNSGMYRSLDGGDHWSRLVPAAALDCGVSTLAIDAGNVLYAGCLARSAAPPAPPLFVSHDLGATWHAAARGLTTGGVTALLAAADGTVWAGSQDAGLFFSRNAGLRWTAAGGATVSGAIGAMAQSPQKPQVLLAGGGFFNGSIGAVGPGIFRSTTNGSSWTLAGPGPDATILLGVVADALAGGRLNVLTSDSRILLTNSGGTYWQPFDDALPPPPDFGVSQIAADTTFPRDLYALGSTAAEDPALFLHSGGPAAPWHALPLPSPCLGPLSTGGGRVFVGADELVCVSADQGATWNLADVGLIAVESVAAAPSNPARVYASGLSLPHAPLPFTFFRSEDGGLNWTGAGTAGAPVRPHGIAVDPLDADLVYMAAPGTGIERSRDGGATWEVVQPVDFNAIWVDPRSPNTIYATSGVSGGFTLPPPLVPLVSVSDDGGTTWKSLVGGLPPNIAVVDLAFDAKAAGRVYVATSGGGVFQLDHGR